MIKYQPSQQEIDLFKQSVAEQSSSHHNNSHRHFNEFSAPDDFAIGHFAAVKGDTVLKYKSAGLGDLDPALFKQLTLGQIPIDRRIDLHGHSLAEAVNQLNLEFKKALQRHYFCLLIIHGKGKSSAQQKPLIKSWLNSVLRNRNDVLAFHSAIGQDGGSGALYLLLSD